MAPTGELKLTDAVNVSLQDASSPPLQGVVAFLGPVSFADGTDWVGVRLTGSSVGKGKNDGSVRGVRYFPDCGPNGGMFVRKGAVTKRSLSRLEELKLRRELKAAGGGGGAAPTATATAVTPGKGVASRESGSAPPPSSGKSGRVSPKPPPSSSSSGGAKSRLEEIRARREALASPTPTTTATAAAPPAGSAGGGGAGASTKSRLEALRAERMAARAKKDASSSAPAAAATTETKKAPSRSASPKPPASTTTAESSTVAAAAEEALQEKRLKIDELTERLRARESENAKLQEALSRSEGEAHDASNRADAALVAVAEARAEADGARAALAAAASAAATTTASPSEEESREEDGEVDRELKEANELCSDYRSRIDELTADRSDLERRLTESLGRYDAIQEELEREREERSSETESHASALSDVRSSKAMLEREVLALRDKAEARSSSDASRYRDMARIQGEVESLRRKIQEMESIRIESDAALEELTLDKEQLQEEKEGLEDRLEEARLDAEGYQLETEELRVELEEAREDAAASSAREGGDGGASAASAASADAADADDVARALSVQNGRLREALLRLREQSASEKSDLTKKLRSAEKGSKASEALSTENESLKSKNATMENEISDLKEMVDQSSAFESMVEELTDRVMTLEDDIVELRGNVREMEEAAEIAAEMEEVQMEENKELMREAEGREAAVRNLEEAIRMQRRREEDFQRTVGNYKRTVETLREEKSALLALREGGEGEKSHLLAQSQKALARASRLVSDAAAARKRESKAIFDRIAMRHNGHLAHRIETLLPGGVAFASSEIASAKGELSMSNVVAKASASLDGVSASFVETIDKGFGGVVGDGVASPRTGGDDPAGGRSEVALPDGAAQRVSAAIHQTKFASIAISVGSDALRLLSAGQWPDVLTPDASADLGGAMLHSVSGLDAALTAQLRTLKEEGSLSPHRSNLSELERAAREARVAVEAAAAATAAGGGDGEALVPPGWDPPARELLRSASAAKFFCLGSAAAIAAALIPEDDGDDDDGPRIRGDAAAVGALSASAPTLEKVRSESDRVGSVLAGLDVTDERAVTELTAVAKEWERLSRELFESTSAALADGKISLDRTAEVETASSEALRSVTKLSSTLRSIGVTRKEGRPSRHPLGPETEDPWGGLADLAREVRSVDGDAEDVNYLARARAVERRLADAMENEPKLALANAKVASLEKGLSTRSKEIALQNSRLAELETLLAQTSNQPTPKKKSMTQTPSTSEEMNTVKEENRVLMEAMDVLHRQVDEYEREIKSLKDSKSSSRTPSRARGSIATPQRGPALGVDYGASKGDVGGAFNVPGGVLGKAAGLEAALFRPALRSARADAALWKSKALERSILSLSPLSVPGVLPARNDGTSIELDKVLKEETSTGTEPYSSAGFASECLQELSMARSNARLVKASISVVDLTADIADEKKGVGSARRSRSHLRREHAKNWSATRRLEEASDAARVTLAKLSGSNVVGGAWMAPRHGLSISKNEELLGRVSIEGQSSDGVVVPLAVRKDELSGLHSLLLQ